MVVTSGPFNREAQCTCAMNVGECIVHEPLTAIALRMGDVLISLGEDPTREGIVRTPERVAKALREMTAGYLMDPREIMRTFDAEGCDQMVAQTWIPFASLCEHHMLPFVGYAHVGYLPKDRVVGLSKFKRVLDVYAKRLQIQERMTKQVCDFLSEELNPRGVMVVIEAEHMCMTIRGAQAPGAKTITSAVTGDFLDYTQGSRQEFLSLIERRST